MNIRSTRSTVTFSNPFTLSGYPDDLPAGDYEVLVEEELLQGLSFEAYRRTATYLTVRGRGSHAGRTELHAISDSDLKAALGRDEAADESKKDQRDAALSPPEDPNIRISGASSCIYSSVPGQPGSETRGA